MPGWSTKSLSSTRLGIRTEAKIEKMQEMINKDLEELKNKQTEMTNTITEMKTTLEGINSRITEAEERISDLEDRTVEFTAHTDPKRKRMQNIKQSISNLWITIKTIYHICTWSPRKRRERENRTKNT